MIWLSRISPSKLGFLRPRASSQLLYTLLSVLLGTALQALASSRNPAHTPNSSSNSVLRYLPSSYAKSSLFWVQTLVLIDKGRWSEACRLAAAHLRNFSSSQKAHFIELAISAPIACAAREPHEWAQIHSDLQTLSPAALWESLESAFEARAWDLGLKLAEALQRNPNSSSTQKNLAAYHRAWILWSQNHQDVALKEFFDLQRQTSEALIKTQALKDYAVLSYRAQKLSNLENISDSLLDVWKFVAQEHKAHFERPAEMDRLLSVPPQARSSIVRALWSLPSAGAAEACHLLQTIGLLTKDDLTLVRESLESKARTCWGRTASRSGRSYVGVAKRNNKGLLEKNISVLELHHKLDSLHLRGWERSFLLEQAVAEKKAYTGKSVFALAALERLICTESFRLLQYELEHAEKRESWPYLWIQIQGCQPQLQTLSKSLPSLKILGSLVDPWLAETQSGAALMELFPDLRFEDFPNSQKKIFRDLFEQKLQLPLELEQRYLQTAEMLPELKSQLGLFHFSRGNFAALSGSTGETLRQSFNRSPALWKSQWKVLWPHRKDLNWPELNQLFAQVESRKIPDLQLLAKLGLERLGEWQKMLDLQARLIKKTMSLARIEEAVHRLQRAKYLQERLFKGLPEEFVTLSQEHLAGMRSELAAAIERSPADKMGLSAQDMQFLVAQLRQGSGS